MYNNTHKIGIIGLGYVGLPLAVNLANHFRVVGFDIDTKRISELHQGHDRTGEICDSTLRSSPLTLTSHVEDIRDCTIYIVTVPTPVDDENKPDLSPVKGASRTVGSVLSKNNIVVYESTVYPGVTEDICAPILEELSGLKSGKHFFLGYSPERINPGDKTHTVDKITKVVAGQTTEVTDLLAHIYGSMNNGNIFKAASIKTAEAAKVIENTQRDINIAFINEITTIFSKLNISIYDVLEAAKTKWNFINFYPGLVGGHCIGVDPYYLAYLSKRLGHEPEVILAGRKINENMSTIIAQAITDKIHSISPKASRLLVLGLTFKEDVPDLRNSKIVDLYHAFKRLGFEIHVHDPLADPLEAKEYYDIDLLPSLDGLTGYDCLVGAVRHEGYRHFGASTFEQLLKPNGLVADIKDMWRDKELPKGCHYWSL